MKWDFLESRAFWSALGPFVSALCILFDVGEDKRTALVGVITSFAGFWVVTVARKRKNGPTSYAEMQRLHELQHEEIEALRNGDGA